MTNILNLFEGIGLTLEHLQKNDWIDDTIQFEMEGINEIFTDKKCDTTCKVATKHIVISWHDEYGERFDENYFDSKFPNRGLMGDCRDGELEWRLTECEGYTDSRERIECFIKEAKKARTQTKRRKKRLQQLEASARGLKNHFQSLPKDENDAYNRKLPHEIYDALMVIIRDKNAEITELKKQNAQLKEQNNQNLNHLKIFEEKKDEIINNIRKETILSLIERLISYAEGEEKKVAREIRIVLTEIIASGYIPSDILTEELKARCEGLGREKQRENNSMIFSSQVGTVVAHAENVNFIKYK